MSAPWGKYSHIVEDNHNRLGPLLRRSHRKEVEESESGSTFYKGDEAVLTPASLGAGGSASALRPTVLVSGEASLDAAVKYISKGKKVMVLIFGSDRKAGGGFWKGTSNLQDENAQMCCPSYYPILQRHQDVVRRSQTNSQRRGVWLKETNCIYTPGVHICRTQDLKEAPHFEYRANMLYMAAMRDPHLDASRQHYRLVEDWELMKQQVRIQYRVAKLHGNRVLVLGAFGCGAYSNPAPDVARAYLEVLDEVEFAGCFDVLDFAMLESRGFNYTTFRSAVEEYNARHAASSASAAATMEEASRSSSSGPVEQQLSKSQRRRQRKKALEAATQP